MTPKRSHGFKAADACPADMRYMGMTTDSHAAGVLLDALKRSGVPATAYDTIVVCVPGDGGALMYSPEWFDLLLDQFARERWAEKLAVFLPLWRQKPEVVAFVYESGGAAAIGALCAT